VVIRIFLCLLARRVYERTRVHPSSVLAYGCASERPSLQEAPHPSEVRHGVTCPLIDYGAHLHCSTWDRQWREGPSGRVLLVCAGTGEWLYNSMVGYRQEPAEDA